MKYRMTVALIGLSLALSSVAIAQDPVGTWNTKMDFNGNVREVTLTISKGSGDALIGNWSSQRGETELSNVAFKAGVLSFARTVSFNGQSFDMTFEGKIDGDKLDGALITDFGEMPIAGTRVAAKTKSDAKSPLIGTWNGSSTSLGKKTAWKLVVAENLSAVIESDDGSVTVRDLALKGDKLSYVLAVDAKGQKFELAFVGTMSKSTFVGRYSIEGIGEIVEVTAAKGDVVSKKDAETKKGAESKKDAESKTSAEQKVKAGDSAAMVGKWTLVGESEMGRRESSMVINEDLTGSVDFGEFGVFKLDYVEVKGDSLGWGVDADFSGQQVYIEFEGKLVGKKFTGSLWAGEREIATMTGSRKD